MSIIIAILVFGLIIAIHELGHFLVAKACNVKINQFAIGMGPAILKKQKGETLYALRLFPIGGYVAMEGEDESSDDGRAFNKKKVSQRIAITVAGAVMNILLGIIVVLIITIMSKNILTTEISKFGENSVSSQNGLQVNDKIVKVNGMNIFTDMDLSYKLQNDEDGIYNMQVIRDGKKVDLENVKFKQTVGENGKNSIAIDFYVKDTPKNIVSVTAYSFKKTASIGRLIWISLGDLVSGKYKLNDLSGPVGIVNAIGTTIKPAIAISVYQIVQNLLFLVAFITINVGIFNLLPLPALDGGRIVFLIIEAIRGKPVKPEHEGIVHFVGLALLLGMMVIVSFNDIANIIKR